MGYFEDIRAAVRRIPRGHVATYGEVARAAGRPGTARQVAWALRDATARRVPWQRVVGAGGRILLPADGGEHQRLLLELEGVQFAGTRVCMKKHEFKFRKYCRQSRSGRARRSTTTGCEK